MKQTEVFCIAHRYCFEITYDDMSSHDICDEIREIYCEYCITNYEDEDGEVSDEYDTSDKSQFNDFIKYLKDNFVFKIKKIDNWVLGVNIEWT